MNYTQEQLRRMVTSGHVCKQFGVPHQTLMRWVKAGSFPAPFRIGRRILRWDAAEIDAWIETQRLDTNTEVEE